ncbi:MAG: class I SAM-dependent methyltransferase, partial [Proteobacteria bacterium]|nr:class I SAM-dependent methyltransferase [Pseudomonadota bacterium]
MTEFKDHFSGHAGIYREARPTYPPALFAWLARQAPDTELAWDCGCGNGQATVALASHFARVVGTDPSANQIAQAEPGANIEYRVEPAERSSLAGGSVSLVSVAQALHWFDPARFYAEAKRVLKPGGVIAAWAYSDCTTGDAAIDRIKDRLYVDLTGPYWPPERVHVDAGYRTLPFPFAEIPAPEFP